MTPADRDAFAEAPALRYLSLGAGRQSTALYLLAAHGHWGANGPTVAIFADTQDEPAAVYRHLDRLERDFGHIIPIRRVTAGRLSESFHAGTSVPAFVAGADGRAAPLNRSCTRDFKILPIERAVKRMLGIAKGRRVPRGMWAESWFGISTDEATRMKDARKPWIRNRYPLCMELRWSADDCERYNVRMGYAAPKSACVYCPYTSDARWASIKRDDPLAFRQAVAVDHMIRRGVYSTTRDVFLHKSLTPLADVDFATAEDRGQLNMFENECEGMCGV